MCWPVASLQGSGVVMVVEWKAVEGRQQDRRGEGWGGEGRGEGGGEGREWEGRGAEERGGEGMGWEGRGGEGRGGAGRGRAGRRGAARRGAGRSGAGRGRARQGRAGQGRAGQGRAGQGRAGQGKAGQGRAGQGRAGQSRAGQGRQAGRQVCSLSYAAIGYADDINLLSPSISGLQTLVDTADNCTSEYGVTFNSKKTECVRFGTNNEPRKIYVNRQSVPWKDTVKYLGHVLTNDLLDYENVMAKKGEFIRSVNRLNAQFHNVQADIRIRLLQTYCTSWYGCHLVLI